MKKKTKGILIGFAALGVIGAIGSPNKKIESIDFSIPNYQTEYDINTNIPIDVIVIPENADISSLEYIADSNTITFSDSGIVTGTVEGSYNVYITVDDIKSDTLSINVVDITAREEAKAEEERLTQEAEKQIAEEEATEQESEQPETTETQIVHDTEQLEATETQIAQEPEQPENSSSEQLPQESANIENSHNSAGNDSNFNTYDNASQQQTEDTYVLNTSRMKIHHPSCSSVKKIAPQNYSTSNSSIDELIGQGYSTCGNCFR